MRRVVLGLVVLLGLGSIGWTGDQVARQLEYRALLDAAELADDRAVWEPYFEARRCLDLPRRSLDNQTVREFYDAFMPEAGLA